VVAAPGAGEGVAGVELEGIAAVLVPGGVTFGLVPGQLAELAFPVGSDDPLEERARGGPELVAEAGCLALLPAAAPRKWLRGVSVAVDDDDVAAASAPRRCNDAAARRPSGSG